MRYYKIVVEGGPTWTSQVGGQNDPGALNVELDVTVAPFAAPMGGSFVRVWGIPLQQISQAANLNKKTIEVYGGMAAGLPLANPAQQGLLARGSVWPAFGNWIGTDMTLDLILQAPFTGSNLPALQSKPPNLVHNWQAGQPLGNALKTALSTAFPGFTPVMKISPKLVLPYVDTGFYKTLESYAGYIKQISRSILGFDSYPGVNIAMQGKNIVAYDGTQSQGNGKQIEYKDLIGQPTWLGLNTVQVKTAMRADIMVGDTVKLPQTLATASASSASQFRQSSVFQGTFLVQQVRHIGNFRQPDGASWVTVIDCASMNTPAG